MKSKLKNSFEGKNGDYEGKFNFTLFSLFFLSS